MAITSEKNEMLNKIQHGAEDLNHNLQNAATQAGEKLRNVLTSANDELTTASEKVTTQIRTHPVQSTVIALGVGMLLGAFLRR